MFTGIVSGKGVVQEIFQVDDENGLTLQIAATKETEDLKPGGSLAVNGVCLTATRFDDKVEFYVMGETLEHTNLGDLKPQQEVNLERCVRADGRLDGHIVQGHVDAVAELIDKDKEGKWQRLRFEVPLSIAQYIAVKGSIAVDGVSLTVTNVAEPATDQQWFEVALIPITLDDTTLGNLKIGDKANIEVDVVAKYTDRLVSFLK